MLNPHEGISKSHAVRRACAEASCVAELTGEVTVCVMPPLDCARFRKIRVLKNLPGVKLVRPSVSSSGACSFCDCNLV